MMGKDYIDDLGPTYEFTFDPMAPPDKIIAAREALKNLAKSMRRDDDA